MKNRKLFIPLLAFTTVCLAALTLLSAAGSLRRASAQQQAVQQAAVQREIEDGPDAAAEYDRLRRLPEGTSEVPVERLLDARERMKAMPRHTSAQGLAAPPPAGQEGAAELQGAWQPLGPGNVGGRTRALLVHPQNPSVMYAAGAGGGVWKSVNGGAAWSPLTDLLPSLAVCALAFDPQNPEVVYAGTGEGFFNDGALVGVGIFKTTDGGANWTQLAATKTADFQYVNKIVVSRVSSSRVYAATRTGVWRSADGGVTWERALDPRLQGGCFDLAARADRTTDYLFASCGMDGVSSQYFPGAAIYRNTDAAGAGVWTKVYTEQNTTRITLALAPSNQNVVYAAVPNGNNPGMRALLRSTSGGDPDSWTTQTSFYSPGKLNALLFADIRKAFGEECGWGFNQYEYRGQFNNALAVDPADENRVWVGCYELFRSDDGGVNWGLASYSWAERGTPKHLPTGQHLISFHPQYDGATNKTMFVAGDGGISRTLDARAAVATGADAPCNPARSAVAWTSLNNDYAVTQFHHGAVFPDGKSYLGGTAGNATVRGTDAGGISGWRVLWEAGGGHVAVDERTPTIIYAGGGTQPLAKSTDGGLSFHAATSGLQGEGAIFPKLAPFSLDPSDMRRVWIAGRTVWRSDDGATKWKRANKDYLPGMASAVAAAPTDANAVLVGMAEGYIARTGAGLTANKETDWPSVRPRTGPVSSVAFDPTDHNVAYATYAAPGGGRVWKSLDGGASWAAVDGAGANTLPDVAAHCVVADPTNPRRLFVGTDLGVYVTADGGANWAAANQGFPHVPVKWLALKRAGGEAMLYAFTQGRGAWRVKVGDGGCVFRLSAHERSFPSQGGAGGVEVAGPPAPPDCAWAAVSRANWVTVNTSNAGSFSYSVAPNTGHSPRVGVISVAGRSFVIRQEAAPDTGAPTVRITAPTVSATFAAPEQRLTISGVAADDVAVAEVTWSSDRHPGVNQATGTGSWTIPNVLLQPGVTNFTVTARDAAGNASRAQLSVVFSPPLALYAVAGTGTAGFGGDGGPATAAQVRGGNIAFDKAGNLYFADSANHRVRKVTRDGVITTVTGTGVEGAGGVGGPAAEAQLRFPLGVAVDGADNLIISMANVNDSLRRVDAKTGIIGRVNYTGGQFWQIMDVAADGAGNIYVADRNIFRVVKISPDGSLTTVAGGGTNQRRDGLPATSIYLINLTGVAADKAGNVYFAEIGGVSKVTPDGLYYAVAPEIRASQVGVDGAGNVYISDPENTRQVYRVTPDNRAVAIAGGGGHTSADGLPASFALLSSPGKVAASAGGTLYFTEHGRSMIWKLAPPPADNTPPSLTITSPTAEPGYTTAAILFGLGGTVTDDGRVAQVLCRSERGEVYFGSGAPNWFAGGIMLQPGLNRLTVTAWDQAGNAASRSLEVTFNPPNVALTLAGNGQSGDAGDGGPGTRSQVSTPVGVAVDRAGNVYFADSANHRVRRVARDGVITTVAGSGIFGSTGDGGPAVQASLNEPRGVAVDDAGNLYIADTRNHRIRRVSPDGVITTVAGSGLPGDGGDGGQAASAGLNFPTGLAVGAAGDLYIADTGNHRLRKLTTASGLIQTVAGTGRAGFDGDGGRAVQAALRGPSGVAVDAAGNLYIADASNHRVRRVARDGTIDTVRWTAGNVTLNLPLGVAVDRAGNLYVADTNNAVVRRVTPDGTIGTWYGRFTARYAADGGPDFPNRPSSYPLGLAVDVAGNLYVTETGLHRVSVVAPYRPATSASAANYATRLTAEAIASVFGTGLATATDAAQSLPLPATLAGTVVKVKDSAGVERVAPLFYVSPLQINYLVPAGTAPGFAAVTVVSGSGEVASGAVEVAPVAPGLFSADSTGQGVAAALALRVRADGSRRYEPVAVYDPAQNKIVPVPLDFGPETDQLYLELYGTGIRGRAPDAQAGVRVGGVEVPLLYAGAQGGWVGLDQVNVQLPRSLAGRGDVSVVLTVDGKVANAVTVRIK